MGKLKTSYNNKTRNKPSARPTNNGKPFIKRNNNSRHEHENDENEVVTGSKAYQKAVQSRDRYREMAREALVGGDRVLAENYHQHADHFGRIINAAHEAEQERSKQRRQREDTRNHSSADTPEQAPDEAEGNIGNTADIEEGNS